MKDKKRMLVYNLTNIKNMRPKTNTFLDKSGSSP